MGGICSLGTPLKEEDLCRMEKSGFLLRSEILRLYRLWNKLGGNYYDKHRCNVRAGKIIKKIPNLMINPWAERICFVFASQRDPSLGMQSLNFDDFLKLCNAFHFRTPVEIKQYWAFNLYDFDNDGLIGLVDCHHCVRYIVGLTMSDHEIKNIVKRVFDETDLDGDNTLSVGESAAVMRKFHCHFEQKFSIKI